MRIDVRLFLNQGEGINQRNLVYIVSLLDGFPLWDFYYFHVSYDQAHTTESAKQQYSLYSGTTESSNAILGTT